jgi:hypothetical protein
MGHQIIKCPDGTLAVFSSFSDRWILSNATQAELEDYYAEKAAEDARESARKTIEAVLAGDKRVYFQFTLTFEEANAMSVESGGEDLAKSSSNDEGHHGA